MLLRVRSSTAAISCTTACELRFQLAVLLAVHHRGGEFQVRLAIRHIFAAILVVTALGGGKRDLCPIVHVFADAQHLLQRRQLARYCHPPRSRSASDMRRPVSGNLCGRLPAITSSRWHGGKPQPRRPVPPWRWDNVLYDSAGLGYVIATHQQLRVRSATTVLTWYQALTNCRRHKCIIITADQPPTGRARILANYPPHPEIAQTTQLDIWHLEVSAAAPSLTSSAALAALRQYGPLQLAHFRPGTACRYSKSAILGRALQKQALATWAA